MNKPLLLKLLLGAPFILPHPAFCQENQTPPIENQTPSIAQKIESAQKYFQTLWQHFESQKIPMPPFAPNLLEKDLKAAFCCNWCGCAAADQAGAAKLEYPAGVGQYKAEF